jgi:exosortase
VRNQQASRPDAMPPGDRWDLKALRRLGRKYAVPAIVAMLGLLSYRSLLGWDPAAAITLRVEGATGWFFSPTGGSPQVVFAAAALLLYNRPHRLRDLRGTSGGPVLTAWLLLAPATALCVWGYYIDAPELLVPSLVLMILGGGSLLSGRPALRCLRFPALFLLFAIPLPAVLLNQIMFPMQVATTHFAAWLLAGLGVPHTVYGDQILTTGGIFQIDETCTGFRAVQAMIIAAAWAAGFFSRSGARAALLVAAAPVVGFLVNGVRVVSLVLIPNPDYAPVHFLQGILTFGTGLVVLVGLDGVLRRSLPAPLRESRPRAPDTASGGHPVPWRRLIALGALLALTAGLTLAVSPWVPPAKTAGIEANFPTAFGEWRSHEIEAGEPVFGSVGFSEWIHRRFHRKNEQVNLFIGVDARLTTAMSLLSPKTAFPGSGWQVVERRSIPLEPDGRSAALLLLQSARGFTMVLHWHEGVDGLPTEAFRSMLSLDRGPFRRPGPATVIRMNTPVGARPEGRARAEARLRSLFPFVRSAVHAALSRS